MSSGAKIILVMLFMLGLGGMANAATVTPASGGGAVPSSTAPGCGAEGTWTTLTGPVVAETAAGQIGLGTIMLSAPAGFEFNPAAAVTILLAGDSNKNRNINNQANNTTLTPTVTANTISFAVAEVSTVANTLTWQNIQVRPTAYTPLASGNITHSGTSAITGVTAGTNFGTLTEVTSTPACHTPPSAITGAATGITFNAATLNGTVSSNGAATTVSFEYGLTAAYGNSLATQYTDASPLAADAVNTAVSADLIGLNCNTVFHYRVVATNSAGTTNGLDGTFTTGSCSAPFPATACAATRFNGDLGCTANDVNITGISYVAGSIPGGGSSCVSGTPVTLDLDLTVNFAVPDRWDVGIFIANDGKLPTVLPANGGASSCSVDILPTTPPFLDLDGVPQGTLDTCGDGNGSIDDSTLPGGTAPLGDGVKRMTGVTLPCYASPASGGKLFIPFAVSWDNQKSPVGSLCTSNLYPVPNTTSKCNAPASTVSINVVVLPVVTKSDGISEINPGANTSYTVTITNNSGGTLLDMLFTDPAVTDLQTPLTVNSVSCASNGGATCPAMTSAQMITAMQGAGILIPSASLPSTQTTTSSLTFTINATLAGTATVGSHLINTANVSVGGNIVSATDDDLIVNAPSVAKSFAPSTIAEGAASLLTVTLTNPTASDVTAVSFSDIYPAGLVNAATANGATTCGGTVTAANGGNSLALSGGTIPASGSCTVTVNVTSAAAGSYNNSTGTVTHSSGSIPAASAVLTVNVAVFGAFNVCDAGTPCTNTTGYISTKIAGAPFSLDIVALNTDGTRKTNYNNTVLVELLDASNNGAALDSYNCRSTWTVIATLAPNPSFSPANNGLITVGLFTVPEAWRDVRVRVTNVGGPARIGCSTDNFAIRPDSIAISATDTDWQTAGTVRVLNNTSATGPGCSGVSIPAGCAGNIHKAGQPFTVTATALNAAAITTANYAGTPALAVGDCTPGGTACTASIGIFALGTPSTFTSGVLTSNVASYSEVGAFNLTLQDTAFASVDALDTAASCAGYYVCSVATAVGRFVPDHFDTAVVLSAGAPMSCPAGLSCPVSHDLQDGLVYSGQAFAAQVIARNAAGAVTLNYDSAKALSRAVTLTAWDAAGGATANPGGGALTLNTVPAAAFNAGTAQTGTPIYTFPVTPFSPTDIYLRAVDTDNVSSLRAASIEGGVKVVSGRVKISNAHGSELLDLPMSATVQYYDGSNWSTSHTDNITSLTLALTPCCAWTTAPTPASGQVDAGVMAFKLSKPSGGGTGTVDVSISTPSYLLGGSNGAGVDPSKPGRATFGIYRSNKEFIYLRESY